MAQGLGEEGAAVLISSTREENVEETVKKLKTKCKLKVSSRYGKRINPAKHRKRTYFRHVGTKPLLVSLSVDEV